MTLLPCQSRVHLYEVRPRKDKRGVNLISDGLPFGAACGMPSRTQFRSAISYATFYSRSRHAVIRVYDEAGNVIETHEHTGEFKEPEKF